MNIQPRIYGSATIAMNYDDAKNASVKADLQLNRCRKNGFASNVYFPGAFSFGRKRQMAKSGDWRDHEIEILRSELKNREVRIAFLERNLDLARENNDRIHAMIGKNNAELQRLRAMIETMKQQREALAKEQPKREGPLQ